MKHVHRNTMAICLLLCAFLFLTACATMSPKYEQPAAPVPAAWPGGHSYKTDSVNVDQKAAVDIQWREFYNDKKLQKLITLALENNRDLKVAALNIERFQALYQIRRADLLPKVDANASATYQRIAENFSSTKLPQTTREYNIGLGVSSYELDLFGRVQSLKGQALEQFLATEQAQLSMQISLLSQVATGWLALAADLERLQLARETLVNQQESYKLTKSRFDAGVSSSLVVNQAQTTVEAARVDIARYTTQLAQDENALDQLVGSKVPTELLPQTLSETLTSLRDISPGLSSDVLLRRPDILQAEGDLKGANANIGAARAAFFPKITLVSYAGFGSDSLSSLFQSGGFVWKFAPQISLPIFDGGTNISNLEVAEVDRNIAVARYEKAIQTAFREVADALAQRGTIDDQLAAQQSLYGATAESFRLSQARYEKGVDSYLTLLDSQRSLYAAQQNLINTQLSRVINIVTLYKVLGGGGTL